MLIAGVDVETTGLDTLNDTIIEICAILWDTEKNTPVYILNNFVKFEDIVIPDRVAKLSKITVDLLCRFGIPASQIITHLKWVFDQVNYVMAFNANFDRLFIEKFLAEDGSEMPKVVWLDAMVGVPYEYGKNSGSLTTIAANHEIINPFQHRAFGDVLTMLRLVSRYSWTDIIKEAMTPTTDVIADVTYKNRQQAKDAGFNWESEMWNPVTRKVGVWYKKFKGNTYKPSNYKFKTVIICDSNTTTTTLAR